MNTITSPDQVTFEVTLFDAGDGITGTKSNGEFRYSKYRTHAWGCIKGWAVAELLGQRYYNHRYYATLSDALKDVAGQLKPTFVHMYGSSIGVEDLETKKNLAYFDIPRFGKGDKWIMRAVEKMAKLGYKLETIPSIAPGQVSILIGG